MPDTPTPAAAVIETPAVTPTPAPPATTEPTPRQAIQTKYDSLYGASEPAAAVTAEPVVAPVVSQPAPVAQPDINSIVNQLVAEVQALRQAQQAPAAPVAPPAAVTAEVDWLAELAAGKKESGEAALAAKIEKLIGDKLRQGAINQSVALINAERDVTAFVNDVRTKNADIIHMEPFIAAIVRNNLQDATAAGKIKTPADYVTVYKQATNAAIETARQAALTIRGEGRQEGITRTTVVSASPTLAPNAVTPQRDQRPPAEPQPETSEDYFAKRAAQQAKLKGLG